MITIEKLNKRFGSIVAVDSLSLSIPEGQLFGFLGPNGAGKTTTIKILAGILKPTSGSVSIGGFDLATHPRQAKQITGYIPDKPFLYEKLSGYEFLEFIARLYGLDVKRAMVRAEEYLDMFRLTRWSHEQIEGYSHGMKQKLVMSSALLHEPRVIIVDEPMVGLDPEGALQVKTIFRQLVRKGVTIFMSTHTLAIAQQLCDRIAIIHQGTIIADGSFAQLRDLSRHQATELEDIFLELTRDTEQIRLAGHLQEEINAVDR